MGWFSSSKFFLAGKGLSFRTGKYLGESVLVGAATGLTVVGFRWMIDCGRSLLMDGIGHHSEQLSFDDPRRLIMVVLPALGALAGYLLIRRFSKLDHARGTDSAIYAYHQREGYITGTVLPVKSTASVLTVASGGSAGYEGPVTLLGAAVGSFIARHLNFTIRARRILMAAGLAGGIGALFQAPLAGALFGFEIFYSSSDVEYETLLPCFVSSAVSYTIYAYFYGWQSLFAMPANPVFDSGLRLLPYLGLALMVVFGVRFYIAFFNESTRQFAMLKWPGWAKVSLGGLFTGVIGFFVPEVLGTSYSLIQTAFMAESGELFVGCGRLTFMGFVLFFFFKAIATSMTVGSGGSGGLFAPALVCGGSLGAAVGMFFASVLPASFGIHPAAFALVGMAGFMASAIRTPLTAIVMVAEISGNHALLVPAMWVCGITFWLNNGWTLYRSQVHSRGSSPVHAWSV